MPLKTATRETRKFHTWKSFIFPQFLKEGHEKGRNVRATVRFSWQNFAVVVQCLYSIYQYKMVTIITKSLLKR